MTKATLTPYGYDHGEVEVCDEVDLQYAHVDIPQELIEEWQRVRDASEAIWEKLQPFYDKYWELLVKRDA